MPFENRHKLCRSIHLTRRCLHFTRQVLLPPVQHSARLPHLYQKCRHILPSQYNQNHISSQSIWTAPLLLQKPFIVTQPLHTDTTRIWTFHNRKQTLNTFNYYPISLLKFLIMLCILYCMIMYCFHFFCNI